VARAVHRATTGRAARRAPAPAPAAVRSGGGPRRSAGAHVKASDQRPDIQGLRAVAVGSVLLYHLWPNRLTGGFVGVDVFFVISGFLIGSHLLRELESSGRIRLGRFWARRAKRLLPASLLVLLVVAAVSMVVVPLSQRRGVLDQVVGSAFYVQNWVLASKSVDYLAQGDAPSPIQHYWTLSTEEQFYILLPLLLALVAVAIRRTGVPARVFVLPVLLLVTAVSLAYSVHLTSAEPGVAYFSTGTRAWEFLSGALLACVAAPVNRVVRTILGWSGAAAILVTVVVYDGGTVFPGYSAALPVVGTLAVLAAVNTGPIALASRLRPVTWIGDISYAVYLWHWPLIILLPYVTERELTTVEKLAIGVVTLVLAWVSTTFVEDPVRFSPRLLGGGRPVKVVGAWMLACTVLVAGLAVGGGQLAEAQRRSLEQQAEELVVGGDYSCLGAGAVDGDTEGCPDLNDILVPDPSSAADDDYNQPPCWAPYGETEPAICTLGPPDDAEPTLRVLAIGDSHNNVYLPTYQQMARELDWEIDVTGRAGCSWSLRPQADLNGARREECTTWKQNIADHLASVEPYDVILTTSLQIGSLVDPGPGETAEEATVDSVRQAWESQIERGSVVVALQDNPLARPDIVQCVEREGVRGADECALPLERAFAGYDALSAAVEQTPGSALVTIRDFLCDDVDCSPVVGNVVVYRDVSHMTQTFVRTLSPFVIDRVEAAINEARDDRP